jgi:enoyl-CoA hydratase/carnithine racemase
MTVTGGHKPLVLRSEQGHVAELVLHRPDVMNAMSTALMLELTTACQQVSSQPEIRAVVLSGAGSRAFCVGADLKERNGFSTDDLMAQRPVFQAAFAAVRDLPVPVIAAVHGYALGGGLELALSCDVIVIDDSAVLGLPEVTVGLVPGGGGTQLLSRRTGLGRALELVLSGRRVQAEEAVRLGIAERRVGEGLAQEEALKLAAVMAAGSPTAVRAAKAAVRAGYDLPLPDALDLEDAAWRRASASPDRVEGIAAFNERRPPVWSPPST